MVIAKLIERRGIGARAEQADALSMARIFSLDTTGVALICLCYIEFATTAQVRYAVGASTGWRPRLLSRRIA